jgi:molybdopterin-guanine dinucleotide biosynthesis protein A
MEMLHNLQGLVMSGGKSSRMGTDKGLLVHKNKIWAQWAFNKLSSVCDGVSISINPQQTSSYLPHFEKNILLVDDILDIGPLGGLLTFHQNFPQHDVMVLATDFLDITEQLLLQLKQAYLTHNDYNAYLFVSDQYTQPLIAIYKSTFLNQIATQYQHNTLSTFSLISLVESTDTFYIDVPYYFLPLFTNYNFPSDIKNSI